MCLIAAQQELRFPWDPPSAGAAGPAASDGWRFSPSRR